MSFSYTVEGYATSQRNAEGQFDQGDLLPARMPKEEVERCERDNPSSGEVVFFHYTNAYNSIMMSLFGDPMKGRFRISLSGHANPGRDNTGTGYTKDFCSTTVTQL